MPLINTGAIAQEINKQILAGIPTVVNAVTDAVYSNTPVLKALMSGQSVTLDCDPVRVEIPPITFRIRIK